MCGPGLPQHRYPPARPVLPRVPRAFPTPFTGPLPRRPSLPRCSGSSAHRDTIGPWPLSISVPRRLLASDTLPCFPFCSRATRLPSYGVCATLPSSAPGCFPVSATLPLFSPLALCARHPYWALTSLPSLFFAPLLFPPLLSPALSVPLSLPLSSSLPFSLSLSLSLSLCAAKRTPGTAPWSVSPSSEEGFFKKKN